MTPRLLLPLLLALAMMAAALPPTTMVAERAGGWLADIDEPISGAALQLSQQHWPEFDDFAALASAAPDDLDAVTAGAGLAPSHPTSVAAALTATCPAAAQGPRFPTGPPRRA